MDNPRYSILYVDDDEINLKQFNVLFHNYYKIFLAESGEKGLDILNKENIDLVITDQRMPGMDGITFLEKVKEKYPDLPRIIITAYIDFQIMKDAINRIGIFHYFEKPIDPENVRQVLDSALHVIQLQRDKIAIDNELKISEEKFRSLAENAPSFIVQIDTNWKVLYTNRVLPGFEREGLIGYSIFGFIPEHEHDRLQEIYKRVFKTGQKEQYITEGQGPEGDVVWNFTNVGPVIKDNRIDSLMLVTEDITDRIKAEEKVISAIIETEDKERARISKEIHDSLQQTLIVTSMNFESLMDKINSLDKESQEKYHMGFEHLQDAIEESRGISHTLMPRGIEDFGLVLSIEHLVEDLNKSTDTKFDFYQNFKGIRLELNYEISLYRITQEAVNNILKYAEAKHASIQLIKVEGLLQLMIEDDGIGFDINNIDWTKGSLGLVNMKSRVSAISGNLNIDSKPGRGTSITIEVPIKETGVIRK